MAINTNTTWTAEHYEDSGRQTAELSRSPSYEGETLAVLSVGTSEIRLDASQLRELAKAAGLVADELEAS